jgi:NADH dehydrogenase/NADH oxidase (H2O2-forming)
MPYAVENTLPIEKTLKKDEIVTDSGSKLIRATVKSVDFNSKKVKLSSGESLGYKKLVIATGAVPVIPKIDGAMMPGVYTFKTENDLRTIFSIVNKGLKHAAVVGSGAIGIELAQALNERGVDTHLFDMADHVLPSLVDYDMSREVEQELVKKGITLHMKSRISSVSGRNVPETLVLDTGDKVRFADADNCSESDSEMPVSIVVFAVGMRPDVDIFKGTDLKIGDTGIVINDKMETNIPDVYAVGDCAEFTSAITGEIALGKLATNAVPMAKVLADNLLGENRTYDGFYNGAATKAGKYFVGGTGLSEENSEKEVVVGYSELTTAFPIMKHAKPVKLKLVAQKTTGKLLGAQILSEEPVTDKVDLLTMAIQNGKTVSELRDLSYSAQPYQSFFPANNLFVAAAEDAVRNLK